MFAVFVYSIVLCYIFWKPIQDYAELTADERRHCVGKKGAAHHWQAAVHAPPDTDPELQAIAKVWFQAMVKVQGFNTVVCTMINIDRWFIHCMMSGR